jgi:uncharacterized membrane protein
MGDMDLLAGRPDDWEEEWSDTTRALAFSDGVFAIIITLLVLDLHLPRVPAGRLLAGLLGQWPAYLAYLASYAYVAVIWLNHKHAFLRIRAMDRGLHWANLGLLFWTALLPFPTAVLSAALTRGNPADERTAVAFYALIGALLCGSFLTLFRYLSHHPRLLHRHVDPDFYHDEATRAWAGILGYAVAGFLGHQVAPEIAVAIFLALPIFYALTSHGLYELSIVMRRRPARGRLHAGSHHARHAGADSTSS